MRRFGSKTFPAQHLRLNSCLYSYPSVAHNEQAVTVDIIALRRLRVGMKHTTSSSSSISTQLMDMSDY